MGLHININTVVKCNQCRDIEEYWHNLDSDVRGDYSVDNFATDARTFVEAKGWSADKDDRWFCPEHREEAVIKWQGNAFLDKDLTVFFGGTRYRVPNATPFTNCVDLRIGIAAPTDRLDVLIITLPDGKVYEIEKQECRFVHFKEAA